MAADGDLVPGVRAARRTLFADGPLAVRSDGDFERISLPESDTDVLRDVLVDERARIVIEIGLAYASSALAIAEALLIVGSNEARHVIVDPYQEQFGHAGWDLMVKAGLGRVCLLLNERSHIALPRLLDEGLVADAAFVDGSHVFHNVFVDLFYLRHLVRPGGLVVVDDYHLPSVATAARYFEVNAGWIPAPLDESSRLHAFRLPTPGFEPSFESFRPFGLDSRLPSPRSTTPRTAL